MDDDFDKRPCHISNLERVYGGNLAGRLFKLVKAPWWIDQPVLFLGPPEIQEHHILWPIFLLKTQEREIVSNTSIDTYFKELE